MACKSFTLSVYKIYQEEMNLFFYFNELMNLNFKTDAGMLKNPFKR